MAGLFNANSQLEALLERQRQQNVAQQQQFGQLFGAAAGNRRQAAANTVGAQVGASFGQGLAGGLFGESEQIQQARQAVDSRQDLFDTPTTKTVQGKEVPLTRAEQLRIQSSKFMDYAEQFNDPEAFKLGMTFQQQALEANKQERELQQRNSIAEMFDKQGVDEDLVTGYKTGQLEYKDVVETSDKRGKPVDDFVPVPEAEKIALGIDPRTFAQRNLKDNKIVGAGGQVININNAADPQIGIGDFGKVRKAFNDSLKPLQNRLVDLDRGAILANRVLEGSGQSNAQLEGLLVKYSGDSRPSNLDIQRVANTGDLGERIASRVSKFIGGTPSEATVKDRMQFIKDMRDFEALLFEKTKESLRSQFSPYIKGEQSTQSFDSLLNEYQYDKGLYELDIEKEESPSQQPAIAPSQEESGLRTRSQVQSDREAPQIDPRFLKYLEE